MHQLDWKAAIDSIRETVPDAQFHNWFRTVEFIRSDASRVVLGVPSRFHGDWLRNNFTKKITDAIEKQCGASLQLEFEIVTQMEVQDENIEAALTPITTLHPSPTPTPTPGQRPNLRIVSPEPPPAEETKPEATNLPVSGNRFVVLDSNRLAYQSAMLFAENPMGMNPLVIYAGVGMGRTLLLSEIGKRVLERFPKMRVRYTHFEAFTGEMFAAIQSNTVPTFKRKYQDETDCLLFDDIQGLKTRIKTQEMVLHIFNEIVARGGRVVFTSSVMPQRLENLIEPLRSRLLSGLITEIQFPAFEERAKLLEEVAKENKINVEAPVLRRLADQGQTDVRELVGSLLRSHIQAHMQNRALDQEFVSRGFNQVEPSRPAVTMAEIVALVEHTFGVSRDELASKSRKGATNWARQVGMYLARQYTLAPLEEIGRFFGRDHATVVHAFQKVREALENHPTRRYEVEYLKQKLQVRTSSDTLPF